MDFGEFFTQYGLLILLGLLIVFMFWSSRRRQQRAKVEQEAKARQTIPGAEVLLQGGLYGTIVAYDPDNLDQPAIVEIAPGVDIKVHSQAILRIVTPTEEPESALGEAPAVESIDDAGPVVESLEDTAARLAKESETDLTVEPDAEPGKKTED